MAKDGADLNTFYSILNNIFGREENENYRTNTRSNLAGTVADIRNLLAAKRNYNMNKERQNKYYNNRGGNSQGGGSGYPTGSIGATGEGVYGVDSIPPQPTGNGIGVDANGMYGVGAVQQPN